MITAVSGPTSREMEDEEEACGVLGGLVLS